MELRVGEEPQHTEAAASSSSPHAAPLAKRRHRQERDAAPAPEAMQREPDLAPDLQEVAHAQVPVPAQAGSANTQGLRQTTLQVPGLLEELKALGAPTRIVSYQRGGHDKVKHTAFHMADVARVKRHMGFGNWTLSWAAFMMAPEIRTVFNSPKVRVTWWSPGRSHLPGAMSSLPTSMTSHTCWRSAPRKLMISWIGGRRVVQETHGAAHPRKRSRRCTVEGSLNTQTIGWPSVPPTTPLKDLPVFVDLSDSDSRDSSVYT